MRKIIIIATLSIFFLIVFIYATYSLPVFDIDKLKEISNQNDIITNEELVEKLNAYLQSGLIWSIINTRNFIFWLAMFGGFLINGLAAMHLIVDKLFYRKFFEQPSYFSAFRRAILVYLMIIAFVVLRLIDGLLWYNIVSLFILVIAIEALTMSMVGTRLGKENFNKPATM